MTFGADLVAAGLLRPMGVAGLVARSATFEAVVDGLRRLIRAAGATDAAEELLIPPVMSRRDFERSGYMASFPHLAGTVHAFRGDERAHRSLLARLAAGEAWTCEQVSTDVVLCPAACYPLYPLVAARGPLPADGATFEIEAPCFRHEPSADPYRMQSFRMREFVRIGRDSAVLAYRQDWIGRAQAIAATLRLASRIETANDPFFGRGGTLLAQRQTASEAKWELVVARGDDQSGVACMSFNYHQERFGATWGLTLPDGATAHSACVGFGLERLALALFQTHGVAPQGWPADVRVAVLGDKAA